jgi:hypothetical protein
MNCISLSMFRRPPNDQTHADFAESYPQIMQNARQWPPVPENVNQLLTIGRQDLPIMVNRV